MIAAIRYGEGGRRSDVAFVSVIVAAGILTLAFLLICLVPQNSLRADIAAGSIAADSGFAYTVPVPLHPPIGFRVAGDGSHGIPSSLQLYENGKPLGPAHAAHVDVREKGGGRYSHWGTHLWFSASDSTDPRINGKTYSVVARASVSPLFVAAVACVDLLVLMAAWRWLSANTRFRDGLINVILLTALILAALVAAGAFDPITVAAASPPKDAALVAGVLGHALAGCAILLAQWMAGAGLARAMLAGERATFANVVLLGFVLGLVFAVVFAVATLAIPYGFVPAMGLWLVCCLPLRNWQAGEREWNQFAKAAVAILPFAIAFGCWIGLLWHGPTETLPGSPSGDQTYYSTSIVSLAKQVYPYLNLGYEYQPLGLYFNMLFPLLGAAFSRLVTLDPFLFIAAGGAATFILGLGLTLYAYVRAIGILVRGPHLAFASAILALTFIVANRYPFWVVESIPMIHAVPLVIIVVYWARKPEAMAQVLAFALAVVGSALSKVVGAAVLAPYVAVQAMPRFLRMSRAVRATAILAAAGAAIYAAYLLYRVGTVLTAAPLGPNGFRLMQLYQFPLSTAWPFILRDISALLLAGVAFLMADWLVACVLAGGFLLFLIYPYVLMFEFVCAAIILGMTACGDPQRLWKHRLPISGSMLLALPAVLLTDPAGVSSGLVWLTCVGSVVWIVLPGNSGPALRRSTLVATAFLCLGLVAVGRGSLILSSDWQAGVLTPQVRQVWLAVKEHTPADALIFTDQTGMEPTLLGAWNTYAFIGARQIFVSNLYQNEATRPHPARARAVLAENDAILRGTLLPAQLKLRGHYSSYFAVVSRDRETPPSWTRIFENEKFRLYKISPPA